MDVQLHNQKQQRNLYCDGYFEQTLNLIHLQCIQEYSYKISQNLKQWYYWLSSQHDYSPCRACMHEKYGFFTNFQRNMLIRLQIFDYERVLEFVKYRPYKVLLSWIS